MTQQTCCVLLAMLAAICAGSANAQTDTTFTYQGELRENGSPANGAFNIDFSLWDAVTGGNQIGTPDTHNGVPVVNGKFTVELDFGADAFDNSDRWLKIVVDGNQLSPLQPITRTPYAIQTRGIFVDATGRVEFGDRGFVIGDPDGESFARIFRQDNDLFVSNIGELGGIHFGTGLPANRRLTISHDGKLGIGTGTPETRLHLRGFDSIMQTITSSSGGGTWIELDNTSTGGERWGVLSTGASNGEGAGKMLLRSISDGRTVMTLQGDGNVGIGTASPVFQLQLTGNAGKPGGGPWASVSDVRLKKNIEPIDDALGTLLSLRGVTFEYIDPDAIHELSGQRIGMIAQEVEKVVPDWVNVRSDGYKTVNPRGFEALTVEALRELSAENDQLRQEKDAEIGELKQQIKDLRQLVHRLMSEKE